MNLYIWEGDGVLTDYSDGMIVVMAPDLVTALEKMENEPLYGKYPNEPTEVINLDQPGQLPTKMWYCYGGS